MSKSSLDILVNGKYDIKEQTRRFQEAQSKLDFTTMYEVLFQTTCSYIKKKQGSYWDWDKIVEVANDICIAIMNRYKKNPSYHINKHATAVYYEYMGRVQGIMYKKEQRESNIISWDGNDMDKYYILKKL